MTSLATSSVQTYVTGWVTDISGIAAVVATATIGLAIGVFLLFKFIGWVKAAL